MSLSYQINIRILLSALVILFAGAMITMWHARTAINNEIDPSISMTAHIIACGLSQKASNDVAWLNCISSLKETRHLKIELKTPDGKIIEIGHKDKKVSEKNPPPIWFVRLIGGEKASMEKQITSSIGEQYLLSIQANPLDEIREVWEESLGFFSTILGLTILTFFSVYLALKQSIKSINSIVIALQTIETGRYEESLPLFKISEYNNIAKAINHMTAELEKAKQENRSLTQHSLEILETERKQLAKELHDELGQSLTAIKMMAVSANRKPSEIKPMTEAIETICENLINVVRTMMHQLHPLVLTELGLKAALEDLVARWSNLHPSLKLILDCHDEVDQSSQNISIQLFRVIQECLTNIVRHAEANQAFIVLVRQTHPINQMFLSVKDNGKGCAPDKLKNGFGLLGMKERIQSLGGSFIIQTQEGKGLEIRATIPMFLP